MLFKKNSNLSDLSDDSVPENNPLSQFLNTLSEEEKSQDVLKLSKNQIPRYIKAVALFQMQAVEDLSSCALKGLILFASRMHRYNLKEMTLISSFDGTKNNVKKENFFFKIQENAHRSIMFNPSRPDSFSNNNHEKNNSFLNHPEEVLNLFNTISDLFQDKSGRDSLLCTANILVYFEYLSQKNLLENEVKLEGLILGEEEINKVFDISCLREEIEYEYENA